MLCSSTNTAISVYSTSTLPALLCRLPCSLPRLAYADEEVDATVAEGRVAQLLNVPQGDALLRIRQVIYSSTSKPVIYVVGLY